MKVTVGDLPICDISTQVSGERIPSPYRLGRRVVALFWTRSFPQVIAGSWDERYQRGGAGAEARREPHGERALCPHGEPPYGAAAANAAAANTGSANAARRPAAAVVVVVLRVV